MLVVMAHFHKSLQNVALTIAFAYIKSKNRDYLLTSLLNLFKNFNNFFLVILRQCKFGNIF